MWSWRQAIWFLGRSWRAERPFNSSSYSWKAKKARSNLHFCAIHISKAFDSVLHSQAILSIFRSGVNPFFCTCLWQWYQNSSIQIHLQGTVSNYFCVRRGVKQGSVLSPAIFNNSTRGFTRHIPPYLIEPYINANHLFYADDIFLLADNLGGTPERLSVATSNAEFLVFGLEITSCDIIQAAYNCFFERETKKNLMVFSPG